MENQADAHVSDSSGAPAKSWQDLIPAAAIVARQRYRIVSVKCDTPVLILPLQGIKNLHFSGASHRCQVGEYLMLHGAVDISIENIPEGDLPYRALPIGFPWRVIELSRQLIQGNVIRGNVIQSNVIRGNATVQPIQRGAFSIQTISEKIGSALHQLLQRQNAGAGGAEIDIALLQLLVALHIDGASGFLTSADPSLAARIRLLVGNDPARDWRSSDFEEQLHVSGATLRRRLVEENTSLRLLIREARLHVALTLLQTTTKPVKAVAAACGYQSLSSFRENFIEQFGATPAAVAND